MQGTNLSRTTALEIAAEAGRYGMSVRELQGRDARLRYNIRVLRDFVGRINTAPAVGGAS